MKTEIKISLEIVQDLLGLDREGFVLHNATYDSVTKTITFLADSDKHVIPAGMRPTFSYECGGGLCIKEVRLTPNGN